MLAGVLVFAGAWAPAALADEAKSPISAAMLLNTLSPAAESRDAAFDRAMKERARRRHQRRGEGPARRERPLRLDADHGEEPVPAGERSATSRPRGRAAFGSKRSLP